MALTVDEQFGQRFLAARRAAGLSQEAVIERIELDGIRLHVTAIGKIERGERRVTVGEAVALARCLGMSIDEILGISGPLEAHRALVREARGELLRASGAYYRLLSEYAKAIDENFMNLTQADEAAIEAEIESMTPARVIAFHGIGRLTADLAARGVETDLGFAATLVRTDGADRMAIIEAAGGIEAVAALVNRDG